MARKYTNHHPSELKLKVASDACREDMTVNEIASKYGAYSGCYSLSISERQYHVALTQTEIFGRNIFK